MPVWKALRIADSTRLLPEDAASFVDRQLAPFAHSCTWAQVDRLVETALVRFDPEAAEERRARPRRSTATSISASTRSTPPASPHGTTGLDIADALDLEQAIARRAKLYGQLGDEDSLDVRRAKALGEIAREDLALDLEVADPETGEITRTIPGRKTELVVHIDATDHTVGRLGNTRTPISVEQIKTWFEPVQHQRDRPPGDRPRRPSACRTPMRSPTGSAARSPNVTTIASIPYCTKPAESCDLDHVEPYAEGGETSAGNLAPKCRGHHRMKTAGNASYRMLSPRHLPVDHRHPPIPGRPHRHPRPLTTPPRTPPPEIQRRGYRHAPGNRAATNDGAQPCSFYDQGLRLVGRAGGVRRGWNGP